MDGDVTTSIYQVWIVFLSIDQQPICHLPCKPGFSGAMWISSAELIGFAMPPVLLNKDPFMRPTLMLMVVEMINRVWRREGQDVWVSKRRHKRIISHHFNLTSPTKENDRSLMPPIVSLYNLIGNWASGYTCVHVFSLSIQQMSDYFSVSTTSPCQNQYASLIRYFTLLTNSTPTYRRRLTRTVYFRRKARNANFQ